MVDPGKPRTRPRPQSPARRAPERSRTGGPGPGVGVPVRGGRPGAPPSPPRDRGRVIFAVLALLVVFSMIFGTVAYVLEDAFRGDPAATPSRQEANLVPTYEARLRENPNDAQALVLLANILQVKGDYPGAIPLYERAVALKPDDLETRFAFARALADGGQRVDAEIQLKKALELDPRNARTVFSLGQLYERWSPPRLEEARAHYTRASELQPEGAWGSNARQALERLRATPTP